ncbi:hypothetical protein KC365_g4946 [Hortaea werneckii]|nr:hypothetical protein KC342_g8262 [Hortaea werneckii]KAI7096703.1 hypothetical protein KC339_g10201 [Hortaea werneckii]KAI7237025.1 hypothetical protein KC365_g4946 [Hortaea werneckii]KAI7395372.1 hypothetical protein KC328_g5756 [Hortaea werneckii]
MSTNTFSNTNSLGGLPYYRNRRQHPHESFLRQLSQILWQDSERISSLEDKLRDLKTINGGLQLDIKSKDDALAKWRAHDDSVSKQLKEYEQLVKDLSRDKEDLVKKLESLPSETQHVREQNEVLKEQLADAHKTNKTLKEAHSQQENGSQTKIKDLADEAARRETTLFELRSELEELKDEHAELQSSCNSLKEKCGKLDEEMVSLKEELEGEKQSNQVLRADAAAGQDDSETLEMVRKEVEHLASSLQTSLKETTQIESELRDERSMNGDLKEQLPIIRHAVDGTLHANQELKIKLEDSNFDNAQLQTAVASANDRCVELEGQNKSLDSQLSSLQSINEGLQLRVKKLEADQSQLKRLVRSNEDELISIESELERSRDKISRVEDERGRIDQELLEKKRTLKNMCHNFDRLKEESKKIGEGNAACTSKLAEQLKTVKQLQDQLSQCQRENEELHALQKKNEDDSRAKQNLADAFETRSKYLDEQIDELKSDLKRKEEEVSAAREFIQQQHAARDDYIRATATPSPFQSVQSFGRSTQPYCKDVPTGPLEQTSPSTSLASNTRSSSTTSPLGNKVVNTLHRFPNATVGREVKVSPAPSVVGGAQQENVGRDSRVQSRDPRLNRIKFSLSPQKRSIESANQDEVERNSKNPKKSRSM